MTEEFDAFATRKQAAALAARLPGYRTVGSQSYTVGLEKLGSEWTSTLFDGPFFASPPPADMGLPAVNTVFVQSADGNTGARRPSDLGGGETDAHLIYEGLSRVRADAVMTGATTIQGSQMIFSVWHPELVRLRAELGLPRHPAQIVATLTGKLGIESELLFNLPQVRVFILTTPSGAAALAAQVERASVDHRARFARKAASRRQPAAASRRPRHPARLVHRRPDARHRVDRCGSRPGHLPHHVPAPRRRARHAVLHGAGAARIFVCAAYSVAKSVRIWSVRRPLCFN